MMKQWPYIIPYSRSTNNCFQGGESLQSNCNETTNKSNRINDFCIIPTTSQFKASFWLRCRPNQEFAYRNDKSRLYDCDFDTERMLSYWEVHVEKDHKGKVVLSFGNAGKDKKREKRVSDLANVVVVIRRRAEHK